MKGLVFTYLLTYGGSLLALFNPYYGLLIYICFGILRPEALWHWSVPRGDYSKTIAIAFLMGWALSGFGSWRVGRAKATLWLLLGFWVWIALQIPLSGVDPMTVHSVTQLSKTFLPFVAGLSLIDSVAKLKGLAWTILLSQGYLAFEFNLQYFDGVIIPQEWRFASIDNNGIAITMCSVIGLAIFLGLAARRLWVMGIAIGAGLAMIHVVLFSMSRGGMLALLVTGAVAFALVPKKPKHYVALVLVIAAGLRLAGPSVREEFLSSFADAEQRDGSAQSRIDLWKACVHSMATHPLGVGMDRWGLVAPQYGFNLGKEAHNTWLQLGAELGVPGLALILGFYFVTVWRLRPMVKETTPVADPWLRDCARMVIASTAGFMLSSSFVTVEGFEVPYYVMLLGAGALRVNSAAAAAVRQPQVTLDVERRHEFAEAHA